MPHDFVPVVIERSLKGRERALVEAALPPGPWLMVCDRQTHLAFGQRIEQALPTGLRTWMLPSSPKPLEASAFDLREAANKVSALIAVGSGTINDLCKYAAHLSGKPYMVFATAPSMNGYVSANASIVRERFRTSVPCTPPKLLACDLEVLAAAPPRLIRSGLGDALCRTTAQADWLLSHHLLGTPYDPLPFEWLKPYEQALCDAAELLIGGDLDAISLLMRSLIASGEGMRHAGGSYPASQGEHMIAHTLEMMGYAGGYHGEEIAVTTLTMARRQEEWLEREDVTFEARPDPIEMRQVFGEELGEILLDASSSKISATRKALPSFAENWRIARQRIRPLMRKATELSDVFSCIETPRIPSDLGWPEEVYRTACRLAPCTRDRFTFLDVT